jgi:YD repeat-containing protein
MNNLGRIAMGCICLLEFSPCSWAYEHPHPEADDPYEYVIRDHAMFLNELSNRRRVNTFFNNEQTVFYGVPIRYVNSSRGNLTFVRRDLVAVGRVPIVVGRIYDSMSRTDEGFGPGWRLSLEESIYPRGDDQLLYVDDSGSQSILQQRGESYALRTAGPTDIAAVTLNGDTIRIRTRDGWTKRFQRRGNRFALAAVRDAYGNTLKLNYQGGKLVRVQAANGRFVAIERDSGEHIVKIADDQGRAVLYSYDDLGRLITVIDMGQNEWRYEYDEQARLKLALDPQGARLLEVTSDINHRATVVRLLGGEYRYQYNGGRTTIRDEVGRTMLVAHNRLGIATSFASTTGFVSEVRLNAQNRVTRTLQDSRLKAKFVYGPNGQLMTLIRIDETGPVTLAYRYDAANRPTEIASSDGTNTYLEYNAAGDLLRKQVDDHWEQFQYTDRGDLRSVANNYGTTAYTHNSDGQIETIASSHGTTRLAYFNNGRLQSIVFADGSVHKYRYNALGLREAVERSSQLDTVYWYDPAGNLIRSVGFDASAREIGQVFDIDGFYRAKTVHHDSGDLTRIEYDSVGNPDMISIYEDPSQPALNYTYDARNRLVAVADGDKIIGSYVYKGTEPDLRDQMDHHTMRVAAARVRYSATIGNIESVVYSRPFGSTLGLVRFDEATQSLELADDQGVILPILVRENGINRQELSGIGAGEIERRVDFDRPSNITFAPPEYATINCAQNCVFYGVELRANTSYNPITVPYGATVALAAGSPQGTTNTGCQFLLCSWYDGVESIGFGKFLDHTFTSSGAHSGLDPLPWTGSRHSLSRLLGELPPFEVGG